MAEMRQLIGKRYDEDGTPTVPSAPAVEILRSLHDATGDIAQHLTHVESHQAQLQTHLEKVVSHSKEVSAMFTCVCTTTNFLQQSAENVKLTNQLNSNKRQLELVNNLNADAAAEKDIMYEVCQLLAS